jgi:PBP1b-binding outer membrane lipoprotein LpoB
MNRFSNKQKELLRQIGGLPKRALTVVSQSFRKQQTSNFVGHADKNPFKLTKETVESQLDNAIKGLPQDLMKSRTEAVSRKIEQGASQIAGSRSTFNNKTARRLQSANSNRVFIT